MADFDYNYALTVLENLRAVLVANINTELAAIDSSLETVVQFTTPLEAVLNFPAVYVEWIKSDLKKSDDESHCAQEHEFIIGVAVTDTEHDAIQKKVLQYVIAATRAFDKMTADDLLTDVTNVLGAPAWEVIGHDGQRGLRVNDAGIYRRDAFLTLIVQFIESKG